MDKIFRLIGLGTCMYFIFLVGYYYGKRVGFEEARK